MKSKGVTTQMKALNEHFLMVVFTLLLNRVHVFANFIQTNTAVKEFNIRSTKEHLSSDTKCFYVWTEKNNMESNSLGYQWKHPSLECMACRPQPIKQLLPYYSWVH